MGKRQKIRTGAGDLVTTPGPLHKQIERSKLAKPKFKPLKRSRKEQKDEIELVDPSLKGKIIIKANKKLEKDVVFNEDGESDNSEEIEEEDDTEKLDVDQLVSKHLEDLDELKLDDVVENARKKKRNSDKNNKEIVINKAEFADIDPKIVDLFTEIGQVLKKYRSGRIPKAFKIIPTLVDWEKIIELTRPDDWSAAAMLHATKIFASTATPPQCQRFYNLILLPRIRDDIDGLKKLHFHMYQCLFKALFKPAAFFKGILLPLCKSNNFSLREAVVLASMLRKASIPQLHAAAALLSISCLEYTSSRAYILQALIEKNYALPLRVLDGIVSHFLRMKNNKEINLTVSWHSCLISFVQHYSNTLNNEQRNELIGLVKIHSHHKITPEILKILRNNESESGEKKIVPDFGEDELEDEMDI
uniref:Bystin n=1 Tax=Meloidogyne incognita TaxID=6306 RepID=A0A914M5K9_MELIC